MKTTNKTTANNANANNANVNNNGFLACDVLNNISATEIQNILKMKNDEIIALNNDGTIYFKYRLTIDENGNKKGVVYDDFTLKISNKLNYHFMLYGLKQKLKDCLAIEKTTTDKNGNKTYNNYSESQLKEIAKNRLEKFNEIFQNGVWNLTPEKTNAIVENAKNKTIYFTILNLRFNSIDKKTALMLNKNFENYVNEIYDLNEKDFKNKCFEYNVN